MVLEIKKKREMKSGRCGKVFKMREIVVGSRKTAKEAHAIEDSKTKHLVVLRRTVNVDSTRAGNIKLNFLREEKKQPEFHQDKSCYIIIGTKSYKEQVKKEIKEEPIVLGNFVVKEKTEESYLGD